MRSPAALKWIGLALLGIAIAAGISIAASRLTSRQIGLASEPISAGDALAPASQPARRPGAEQRPDRQTGTGPGVTAPPETTAGPTPPPPVEGTEAVTPEPPHEDGPPNADREPSGGDADD